ncbi:ABC transporter permease [Aestuariimicrobium ganziense]|uniref:ABC transporter permease n=1 Tax=Aestuariimicrobium ganziense TaxID=2773677 RepID=UPI001941BBEE|nr:FtsX-like permease family protein [Aestuariimicrobium ganziense]
MFRDITTRLAWRDITRHRRRSLLIVLLVLLPIVTVTALAAVALDDYNQSGQVEAEFGNARAKIVTLQGADGTCRQVDLATPFCANSDQTAAPLKPLGEVPTTGLEVRPQSTVRVPMTWRDATLDASVAVIDVTSQPERFRVGPLVTPRAGEVLLVAWGANRLQLGVGDTVSLAGSNHRIVGLVRTNVPLDGWFVVPPGHPLAKDAEMVEALVVGAVPNADQTAALNRQGAAVLTKDAVAAQYDVGSLNDGATAASALMVLVGALALVITATMVAAAFTIGVRQQRRTLALLGATGAPRAVLQGMVTRQGLLLGLIGSALGVAVGTAVGLGLQRWIESQGVGYPRPVTVPWLVMAGLLVVGTLAALVAAWIPSQQVVRQDVMTGIRRSEAAAPPVRRPWLGLGLAAAGLIVGIAGSQWARAQYSAAARNQVERGIIPAVGSVVLLFVAALLMLGWLLTWLGRAVGRGPLATRLAARDWSRNRARASAAVAATMAMMALATTMIVATASVGRTEVADWKPTMTSGFVTLVPQVDAGPGQRSGKIDPAAIARTTDKLTKVMGQPRATAQTTQLIASGPENGHIPLFLVTPCDEKGCRYNGPGSVILGDADTVAFLTRQSTPAEAAEVLAKGGVVVFGDGAITDGKVSLTTGAGDVEVPAVQVGNSYAPPLVGRAFLDAHKATVAEGPTTTWLDYGRLPTADERERLDQVSFEAGVAQVMMAYEPGPIDHYSGTNKWFTVAFGALLVAVATVTTALTLRDARASMTTLATIGARRRTLRGMSSVMATSTTTLGLVLGVLVALVPLVIAILSSGDVVRLSIPWHWLGALFLVVPVALAVIGWVIPPAKASAVRAE